MPILRHKIFNHIISYIERDCNILIGRCYLFGSSKGAVSAVGSDRTSVLHTGDALFLVHGVSVRDCDGHAAWMLVARCEGPAGVVAATDSLVCVVCWQNSNDKILVKYKQRFFDNICV